MVQMNLHKIIISLSLVFSILVIYIIYLIGSGYSFVSGSANNTEQTVISILYIILLGFVPPIIWLVFWMREDPNPEPRREIMIVFLAGMAVVAVAILLENFFNEGNKYFRDVYGYGTSYFQVMNLLGFALDR